MSGEEESRICGKLDDIQKDVTKTKESAIRIEEKVKGHDDDIGRHEDNINDLIESRNLHEIALKSIEVEDKTKEKLKALYATKKQFRITKTMWAIGLLVTALITSVGWTVYLLRMIATD